MKIGVINRKTGHDPCVLHFNAGSASLIDRYTDIPWRGKFVEEPKTPSIKTRMLCLRSEFRHRILLAKLDLVFVKGLSDQLSINLDKVLDTIGIRK